MHNSKYKLYKPTLNKITEENNELKSYTKRFYSCLNTITKDEISDSRDDILQDYKINKFVLKEEPSEIKADYKKAFYKIQLNKTDWDKVFEADNMPIDYKAINQFMRDTDKFYE